MAKPKIVAITSVGSYPVPWLPWGIASYYNLVEEIVVVNSGYNYPLYNQYDAPMPEVTAVLKEIDPNGKIHEVQHVTYEAAREFGPEVVKGREGIRALGMTYANDIAVYRLNADWILRYDSDQVFYPNVRRILELVNQAVPCPDGFEFFDWKAFWLSQDYMLEGGLPTPAGAVVGSYNDGPKLYVAKGQSGERQFFYGEGGITHYRQQSHESPELVCSAHFRDAYPAFGGKIEREKLFETEFRRAILGMLDQDELYGGKAWLRWKKSLDEIILTAWNRAKYIAYSDWKLKKADPPAPEVFQYTPRSYIDFGLPKPLG